MLGPRVGPVTGPKPGIAVGISAGEIERQGVPQDGPNGWFVPSSALEFAQLGIAAPTSLYLCQETSGNLADSVGGNTLTAAGTVGYQASLSGWTRKGVTIAAGAGNRFGRAAGQSPMATTEDILWIVYVALTAAVGSVGSIIIGTDSAAATELHYRHATNGKMSIKEAAVAVNNPGAVIQDGGARALSALHDNTNTRSFFYSEFDKQTSTYSAALADGNKGIGGDAITNAAAMTVLWGALWIGANARLSDAQLKTRLQALNITIPWS